MGMSSPSGARRTGRGRRRARFQPMSEINVTPFVDVMLVLLIIFMVAAPLLTVGVPIDLPESQANPIEGRTDPINISITPEGAIYVNEAEVAITQLVDRLGQETAGNLEERIQVRGDASANYGIIMRVMGRLNRAGYNRLALVTTEEPS
ncbi:protein TolR [Acuticoccus sediminis]|uniref:Protein TolR n=1 Tax=Acuticoccus sediminis TaxID=2184697 RepID=A0A8B2NUT0_9HYPH|nr:biopolymer transporter ExbD [Acuticoccus sediminis]RAI03103.1 protein TolR [Acuticoccus sediminis]